jgi:hypothetical protein
MGSAHDPENRHADRSARSRPPRHEVARRYLRLAKIEYQREVIVHLTASAERR